MIRQMLFSFFGSRPDALRTLRLAVGCAVLLAGVSTLGDWIWAMWIPRHRAVYGLVHGAILCSCLGGCLGAAAGSQRGILRGAIGGCVIGLISAAGFYAIAPFMGYAAMFLLWIVLWILMAGLYRMLAGWEEVSVQQPSGQSRRRAGIALRGVIASLSSGLAFYTISGIWTSPHPDGPNYAVNLASWFVAFFPGFFALLSGPSERRRFSEEVR